MKLFTRFFITALVSAQAFGVTIETHTAGPAGFFVNSHLIVGEKSQILVDSQFTRSEAEKLVKKIRANGRTLSAVIVTHGHPDHYFGLEVVHREFPDAKILATQEVIDDIKSTFEGKLAYWSGVPAYRDEMPRTLVMPERLMPGHFELDSDTIQVRSLPAAESEHSVVVYVPSARALLTGDLTYHGVHLWLAENRPESWLNVLSQLSSISPVANVYPGHGKVGTHAVIAENRRYIETFLKSTAGKTRKEAMETMKAAFPDYELGLILELSVNGRLPK